jgi:hypothetical protein
MRPRLSNVLVILQWLTVFAAVCRTEAVAQPTTSSLTATVKATTTTLSSAEECETGYMRWFVTEPKNGVQFFLGRPKKAGDRDTSGKSLLRFDSTRLEVTTVLSSDTLAQMGATSIWALTVDDQRRQIAIVSSRRKANGGFIKDITVVDTQRGNRLFQLADGQSNGPPTFSPDGKYLAFYSSDPDVEVDPAAVMLHGAGRVVDLGTKKVTTLVPPVLDKPDYALGMPLWVDSERVLFVTFLTDKAMIAEQVKSFQGDKCLCVVLAYCTSGEVKRLMMPGAKGSVGIFLDPKRQHIVVSDNMRQIVQTDYDLRNRQIVFEVDDTKRLRTYGIREDGTLNYKIRENVPEVVPRRLFE